MIVAGVLLRMMGRMAIALALVQSLNLLVRWFQMYVMNIEPVTHDILPIIMVIGGILLWTFGDVLVAFGLEDLK